MADEMLTTKEVAERLKVSQARVRALIQAGRLPSQQFGRDHLIKENDLKLVEDRKPGRPPKPKVAATTPKPGKRATGRKDTGIEAPSSVGRVIVKSTKKAAKKGRKK
jgi:excisionase family DNA binding protein